MATPRIRPVVGVFTDREHAQAAIAQLKDAGFRDDQLGVVSHDARVAEGSAYPPSPNRWESQSEDTPVEGGIAGAMVGAGVGGLWVIGMAAGIIPGVGSLIAGGLLANLLAGAAAGAAAGGLVGALVDLGMSEEDAKQVEDEVRAGRTILTVQTADRRNEAIEILRQNDAINLGRMPARAH